MDRPDFRKRQEAKDIFIRLVDTSPIDNLQILSEVGWQSNMVLLFELLYRFQCHALSNWQIASTPI